MTTDRTIRKWHSAIIDDAERIVGRSLTDTETHFITSRTGCIALEMIHDNINAGTRDEVVRYLNCEAEGTSQPIGASGPSQHQRFRSAGTRGMTGLFPGVPLRWREPRILQPGERREAKRSLMRMMSISFLASVPIISLTQWLAPEALARLCLVLLVVLGFMLFAFWVYATFPSWIVVSARGISQSVTSEDEQMWKFDDIRQCEIAVQYVAGNPIRMLFIETLRGDRASVGISDSVSTEELESVLTGKGVKVIRVAEPEGAG